MQSIMEAIKVTFTARVSDSATWGNATAYDHMLVVLIVGSVLTIALSIRKR